MRMRFAAACLVLFALPLVAADLEIHYINVGWGGAVLVRGPNGTTVLLSGGGSGHGTNEVVPYLKSIGIRPADGLDYTIVGHQHEDHLGGLDEVVQAGYDVRVKNYFNGSTKTSTPVRDWNTAAATTTAGAPVAMGVGTKIDLGDDATLTCVAGNARVIGRQSRVPNITNENDLSLAILIQHGGFDYLWASDMGGGLTDQNCTGRSTAQKDMESFVIKAISPGGAAPMISAGGIDVLHVNHHGSESSTNATLMNFAAPAVALIGTGAGQAANWNLPRKIVVEGVLGATLPCITVPAAFVLQTEEGKPRGQKTSRKGFSVGNIVVTTDGESTFTVDADGAVSQGPSEVVLAGLPRTFSLDDRPGERRLDIRAMREAVTPTASAAVRRIQEVVRDLASLETEIRRDPGLSEAERTARLAEVAQIKRSAEALLQTLRGQ
jgi:competence protein ComEC